MEVETLLRSLGTFSRWQMSYFIVLGVAAAFPSSWHMVSIVWLGYEPPHHCKVPANSSTLEEWIPLEEDGQWSKCKMYVNSTINNQTTDCLHGWQYEGDSGPTFVTQFDLVCGKNVLVQTSQSIFVGGIMTGSILFTMMSDRWGRKPIYLFAQMGLAVVGTFSGFSPNLYVFLVSRFLNGMFQQGVLLVGFVLTCELFSAEERTFVGLMADNFWAAAISILPLLAYLINNWTYLQLFISLFCLINIPLFWFLPESVVWLYANVRIDEAKLILRKAASINKVTLPEIERLVKRPSISLSKVENQKELVQIEVLKVKYSILDLFRNLTLLKHLVISTALWMIVTLVYYGLTWSTAQLSGNRFLNGFYSAIVEVPAYTLSYFLVKKYGRRIPVSIFFLICGVALFILPFIAEPNKVSIWSIILNMVGKFGVTGAFGIIFMYSTEIFPTNLRSQALGLCSFFGRVGTVLASFASYVVTMYPTAMAVSFAFMSLLSAVIILFLPETNHKPLPETIEEIEGWKRKKPERSKNNISEIKNNLESIKEEKDNLKLSA